MKGVIERQALPYTNLSSSSVQSLPNYQKQYCNIYLVRLRQMTVLLEEQIAKKWGTKYPICKLHKISEQTNGKSVVIGTLFKDQKLKPSVLKQLTKGNNLVAQPILTHFTDQSDLLYIEDELQRYQIIGPIDRNKLVTGISCALLGTDDGKGKFLLEEYVFADFRTQIPRPIFEHSAFVVFVSGLDLVNSANFTTHLQLLSLWLSGLVDLSPEVDSQRIIRLIIAGNAIRNERVEPPPSISLLTRRPKSDDSIQAVKLFDKFLLELCKVIDVDVMPGENDPSNHVLPQKAMHHCMFPLSYAYKSLNRVSNPYYFETGGLKIMGSSGQPISDVMRYAEFEDPLEAMEACLKWSHIAPTAPDTLGCFPFYENDPFIIEECPHVMFVGNQKAFGATTAKGPEGQSVRLISIPEFSATFQVAILNIKTLDCNSVSFNT